VTLPSAIARRGPTSSRPRQPSLVADIGGTNARFALVSSTGDLGLARTLATGEHASLAAAAKAFLAAAPEKARPAAAAIAVASPVTGDRVDMTNHPWSFSIRALKRSLGLAALQVVNDFAAIARAIPELGPDDSTNVGGGAPVADRPIGIIGPGTGLGVAGLVVAKGHWHVLDTEGGHATLPAATAREAEIIAVLRDRFGHVSAERAISGPGLVHLYEAIATLEGADAASFGPSDVLARGRAGTDPLCAEALATFCAMLGTVAGNLALSLGALGGVYVAGGMVPRLGSWFASSPFRPRFEDKGRFRDYQRKIPTRVVTHPNPGLLGLAAMLRERG
jgi:glucokinase